MRRLALILALIPSVAHAGGYPGYVQQQQAYAAPYQRQYVEKVYYQFLPVLTAGEYYGGMVAGQLKQQKALAVEQQVQDDLFKILGRIEGRLDVLEKSVGQPGQPAAPAPPAPQPPVPPEPDPTMPASGPPPAEVFNILSKRCAKCHATPAKAGGGFVIFDGPESAGLLADLGPLDLLAIDQQTYSGTMPPDKPLAKEEYDVLRAWINESHDEITAAIKAAAAPSKGK